MTATTLETRPSGLVLQARDAAKRTKVLSTAGANFNQAGRSGRHAEFIGTGMRRCGFLWCCESPVGARREGLFSPQFRKVKFSSRRMRNLPVSWVPPRFLRQARHRQSWLGSTSGPSTSTRHFSRRNLVGARSSVQSLTDRRWTPV